MKRIALIIACFSTFFVTGQSGDTLAISELSHIKSSTNIQGGLGLIDYDYQVGLGISGHIYFSNILEKFSGTLSYVHSYLGANDTKTTDILPESYYDFNNRLFDIGLGYTFKQNKVADNNELRLSGNSTHGGTITFVDHQVIKSFGARFGLQSKKFGLKYPDTDITLQDSYEDVQSGETIFYQKDYPDIMMHQQVNLLYAGVSLKKSFDSYFEVERFGKRRNSLENETYFDLLLNIGSKLLPIQKFVEKSIGGGAIKTAPIPTADQIIIQNKFKILPIGFRIGHRLTNRKPASFSIDLYGGLSPAYYLKIQQTINVGVKINFRIFKAL